jgi:hypothetical protein
MAVFGILKIQKKFLLRNIKIKMNNKIFPILIPAAFAIGVFVGFSLKKEEPIFIVWPKQAPHPNYIHQAGHEAVHGAEIVFPHPSEFGVDSYTIDPSFYNTHESVGF